MPGKSPATLFTGWTEEVNEPRNIAIVNAPVPENKDPKIIGMTFDLLLTFNKHAKSVNKKDADEEQRIKDLTRKYVGER